MAMTFRFADEQETALDVDTVLESHAVLRRLHGMSSPPAHALVDRIDRAASSEGRGLVLVHDGDRGTLRAALDEIEQDGELTSGLAALRELA